jgi:DNA recombination-dependent growth factor C
MRREDASDLGEPAVAPVDVDVERLELVPLLLRDRVGRIGDDEIHRAIRQRAEELEDIAVPQLSPRIFMRERRTWLAEVLRER